MPPRPERRLRYLVISNGHGEDAIASALVRRLTAPDERAPARGEIGVDAYPMIGSGRAYDGVCALVGPRAHLASEGWRNVKGSLRRDLASGGLFTIPPALKFLRAARGHYDRLIVIGDMVGVLAALLTGHRDVFYIDVYKTGAARLYSRLEAWAIAKTCASVFCRADPLAESLRRRGVDARCAGNIMMDAIPQGAYDAMARRTRPLGVTLLPGSRALTAESFALQVAALRTLPAARRPDIFLAVAGTVNIADLATAAGLRRLSTPTPASTHDAPSADLGALGDDDMIIHMARGTALGPLLAATDLVMSQAGTATVQALGVGRPVLTFVNPRDRRSRFADEQKLFGPARIVLEPDSAAIGQALTRLLDADEERARLSALGRARIGGPGAMTAILRALFPQTPL